MSRDTTAVLILKDFNISELPYVPQPYLNRIDVGVWNEFTNQIKSNVHNTFSQTNAYDISTVSSIRRKLYYTYMICSPLTCICAFCAYYGLVLTGALGALPLAIGALCAIIAVICLICSIYS
eukprot:378610_1